MLIEFLSLGLKSLVSVLLVGLLNKVFSMPEISKIKQSKVTHWLHDKEPISPLGEICFVFLNLPFCLPCFLGKLHFIFEFDDSTH